MGNFAKEVWTTLSAITCDGQVELKGRLSYLSWANAWTSLMDAYPASTFASTGELTQPDSSIEVMVSVTVSDGTNGITRTMSLPVMDNRNNAILAPNARDISDTRMRCLVKCIALFGLGLFLYRGEDIPQDKPKVEMPCKTQYALLMDYMKNQKMPARRNAWLTKGDPDAVGSNWQTMTAAQASTIIKECEEL